MTQPNHLLPAKQHSNQDPPHYRSFLIRCFSQENGGFRARIMDVQTGKVYPLADLAGVPEVLVALLSEENADQNQPVVNAGITTPNEV